MQEHRDRLPFRAYADAFGLSSVADAYAVQRAYVRRQGEARDVAPRGYKIGLTSARMQAMCGIDSPLAGVVLGDRVHASGASLARADYGRLGLEFEIAVETSAPAGRSTRSARRWRGCARGSR
jgi:2-keto-4-pentenoate hydratase